MTSPIESKTSADDGAPSDDDGQLASGATKQGEKKTDDESAPSAAGFTMLGLAGGDACGPAGCSHD